MSALRILAFLALIAGFPGAQTSDCSYWSLLNHFNLTTTNDALTIMRPVREWTSPTDVMLDMVLFGILEVDEKSQCVTSHIWVQMAWTNEFLIWNASDFCGMGMFTVPRSKLWIPDITIHEDASDSGTIQKGAFLSVYPGYVLSAVRQRLTSTCQLQLYRFPFDRQSCNITFTTMNSDDPTIQLASFHSEAILTAISEKVMVTQGEWELEKIDIEYLNSSRHGKPRNELIYTVTISRKPMLYVINFIVPLFYLLVLDLASFFISEARGEKMSFKVTILLSISVLLLILKDMLPSTESSLPLIASYCVAIFALVGISVLEAMMVIFITDLDEYFGPKAETSVDHQEAEIQLEVDYDKNLSGADESVQARSEKGVFPADASGGFEQLNLILQEVKAARQEAAKYMKVERKMGYYRRVAEIVDHSFFWLYLLTIVTFLGYMYVEWVHKK